ncbi:tetronasin resistance protein, partial [Enterococcus faecium]
EMLLINLLLGLLIGGLMMSFGVKTIDAEGAFLFGGSIALAGIIGGVLARVMSQIMATSTGATGSTLSLIGLLYIVRAGTDVSNLDLS